MWQKNWLLMVTVLVAGTAFGEGNNSRLVRVESLVLSDVPSGKTAQLPIALEGVQFNLAVAANFYHLSETIKWRKNSLISIP